MAGGGGSADQETSLSTAADLAGRPTPRWGRREWARLALALLPLVLVTVVTVVTLALA